MVSYVHFLVLPSTLLTEIVYQSLPKTTHDALTAVIRSSKLNSTYFGYSHVKQHVATTTCVRITMTVNFYTVFYAKLHRSVYSHAVIIVVHCGPDGN